MREFLQFLEKTISAGLVAKRQVQPARVSFFVPLWWHLHDTEQWPIFYPLSRKALQLEGLYSPTQDPVEAYFAFRDCFLKLASTLGLRSWETEHLCAWYERTNAGSVTDVVPDQDIEEADEQESPQGEGEAATHTQIQWLLAKIGHSLGCDVSIAANDRNKEWKGERLAERD